MMVERDTWIGRLLRQSSVGKALSAAPRIALTLAVGAVTLLLMLTASGGVEAQSGTIPTQEGSTQDLADVRAFLTAAQTQPGAVAAAAPEGRTDIGSELFTKVGCYQCHGNEAQGGLSGPRIGPDPIPFRRFAEYLRSPTGEMPPYTERVLSDVDLADIYAFLEARPRPPAVDTIPQLAP